MNETYLVVAYIAIWVGLTGYVAALAHRQRKLSQRIEILNKRHKTEED